MRYENHGRIEQKGRTRAALIDAARTLIARGEEPAVETAAQLAAISRATAYRYFPTQRALLEAAHPEVTATTLLPENGPTAPEARLDAVVAAFTSLIRETEVQQRAMLRLSLEPSPDAPARLLLRQGRAIGWISEALEPLRDDLGDDGITRLACAIRSAIGIESLVWLTDVAGLTREHAAATMAWSARAMLRAAIAEGAPR